MAPTRSWQEMWSFAARLLKERTGKGVDEWNRLIKNKSFKDEKACIPGWESKEWMAMLNRFL